MYRKKLLGLLVIALLVPSTKCFSSDIHTLFGPLDKDKNKNLNTPFVVQQKDKEKGYRDQLLEKRRKILAKIRLESMGRKDKKRIKELKNELKTQDKKLAIEKKGPASSPHGSDKGFDSAKPSEKKDDAKKRDKKKEKDEQKEEPPKKAVPNNTWNKPLVQPQLPNPDLNNIWNKSLVQPLTEEYDTWNYASLWERHKVKREYRKKLFAESNYSKIKMNREKLICQIRNRQSKDKNQEESQELKTQAGELGKKLKEIAEKIDQKVEKKHPGYDWEGYLAEWSQCMKKQSADF